MRRAHPYVDRGRPGALRYLGGVMPLVREPPIVPVRIMKLAELRRHNTLEPELQETHRLFLRWGEREGTGMPNPDADIREAHYDPLPLEIQQRVSSIVAKSPWLELIHKVYLTNLARGSVAEQLGVSRAQFNANRRAALWYFRGRFEAEKIPMLASASRPRASNALW